MGRLNPVERRLQRFLREPPSVRNAASVIVIATTVVVAAGVVINLLDSEEYPDVGVGMWWALQTSSTRGARMSVERGRAARVAAPRRSHAEFSSAANRSDPVDVLVFASPDRRLARRRPRVGSWLGPACSALP